MRTAVTLDDALHETIRRRAFDERRSFTDLLNEVVRSGLTDTARTERRTLGSVTGKIQIADDFDGDLADMESARRELITP